MAWNDVYKDDNAIHFLIKLAGKYTFNFSNGVDIKVERKIGDTLSKFTLNIIDDKSSEAYSSDYIEFEQILLDRFTNIEVEYGNSSKTKCAYTGFVVDYQPAFLGTSSKLSVTGYLTRKQKGLPDQSSPYTYYISWAPLVGRRKDITKDWDDIYNGKFSFDEDSYSNTLKDEQMVDPAQVQAEIDKQVDQQKESYYNSKYKSLISRLSSKFSDANVIAAMRDKGLIGWTYDDNGNMVNNEYATSVEMGEDGTLYLYMSSINYDEGYLPVEVSLYSLTEAGGADIIGDLYNQIVSFVDTLSHYDEVRTQLYDLSHKDTYGNAAKRFYEIGHVPWEYEMMKGYKGNILFTEYSHPVDKKRTIARVVPDIFIEWDKDLPMSPEYVNEETGEALSKDRGGSGNLSIFPDWAINDIKVFGLQYIMDEASYMENQGDPYSAFTLLEDDMHGVRRVYTANKNYYIWVGDCPDLFERYKNSDWKYCEKDDLVEGAKRKKVDYISFTLNEKYTKGTYVINDGGKDKGGITSVGNANGEKGYVLRDFVSYEDTHWNVDRGSELNASWENALDNRYIQKLSSSVLSNGEYGEGLKKYVISDIEDDKPRKGMKAIKKKDRITQYLQAAYRSGQPLEYGVVYISDIVAQLCILEGWSNPYIVSTAASSYKSDFLAMEGMSALEYISQKLCPNAVEAGGTGRAGFQCHFDTSGRFHFEPVDINGKNQATVLTLGYNIKDTPVISFTVRSRGQILMLGVDESVSEISSITGETISVSTSKSELKMSETEARLSAEAEGYTGTLSSYSDGAATMTSYKNWLAGGGAEFFNLSLFNYYGYEPNVESYLYFTGKIADKKGVTESMPYGTSLIRRTYNSSTPSSISTTLKAVNDLNVISKTCIQAELTMVGDNNLIPGQWIQINNYTRRGRHYSSGKYYIQSISDNVSAGNGFTQTLRLWRYSSTVHSMNNTPSTKAITSLAAGSLFEEGLDVYMNGGYDKFQDWYAKNYPQSESVQKEEETKKETTEKKQSVVDSNKSILENQMEAFRQSQSGSIYF